MKRVFPVIYVLQRDPWAPVDLIKALSAVDDPDLLVVIEALLAHAARWREVDGRVAARSGEKLVAPVQTVSLGVMAAAGIALATGTLLVAIALPILVGAGTLATVASWGRWRLSRREDEAKYEVDGIKRLADALKVLNNRKPRL